MHRRVGRQAVEKTLRMPARSINFSYEQLRLCSSHPGCSELLHPQDEQDQPHVFAMFYKYHMRWSSPNGELVMSGEGHKDWVPFECGLRC